ncbi:MAG: signal protein PDZ [Nisaea sp.]|nr:signal protein PDZ [Nisaea sp.]OUX92145.1 MAG: signal protein PDZ [Candidatus Endolissoclinum sp. TMED26]
MPENADLLPKLEDFDFNLKHALGAVVALRSHIPDDAFTASILGDERAGNGILINDSGLVLTIGYLITEAETIWITGNDGQAVAGCVQGYDQETGFGLIQALGPLDLPHLELGESASVREGDRVVFAGHGGAQGAVVVEVIGVREFAGYWEYLLDEAVFTAPAHPNWGGGAVIDRNGRLVAVGSLFVQQSGAGAQPVDGNMAVPIDLLKPILNDLLSRGCANRQPRPWLGLFGTEIEDRLVVAALSDDGPAEQAEVSVGDIVVKVAGQPVETLADFFRRVWSLGPAGVDVPITINRDGETFEMTIESIDRNSLLKTPRLH